MIFTDEQYTCLVENYIDTVFRVALNYLKEPSDAEDVTQNVFEKLLHCNWPFASEDHLKHWLIRVAINECKHILRAPWRSHENIEDYARTLSFDNQSQSGLFQAVMGLPRKYRLPIYLHYYEGYTTQEIGQILKLPKNTVCSHLKRGREQLKTILQEAENT